MLAMIKKVFIVLIAIIINYSCVSSKKSVDHGINIMQIDFQDFFIKDKVDLTINDCQIVKDLLLTSNKADGFTGVSIELYLKSKSLVIVKYLNREYVCKVKTQSISVLISLNGEINTYTFNLANGKYIGFSKKMSGRLLVRQEIKPFVYY